MIAKHVSFHYMCEHVSQQRNEKEHENKLCMTIEFSGTKTSIHMTVSLFMQFLTKGNQIIFFLVF